MLALETPIAAIPRYGKLFAKRLLKLKITTVCDLLLYFPFRYEDLSRVVPIGRVAIGERATIRGTVIAIQNRRSPRKRMFLTEALVRDTSGTIRVMWFNQPFLPRVLTIGSDVWFAGVVSDDGYGIHVTNPVYEKVEKETLHTARIVPVYPVTRSLTQKPLRVLIHLALPSAQLLTDALPLAIEKQYRLLPFARAVATLHFPETGETLSRARRRMAFAELFAIHANVLATRAARAGAQAPAIRFFEKETKAFVASLPFRLTDDQRKAAWEILGDLQRDMPMRRLLDGDVGSGKTVVAGIAALNVVLSGLRVLFMAPTEILAEQHARTLTALFAGTDVRVGLLTASHKLTKKERKEASVVIGTHALLHAKEPWENVGLVVVDEQHRFGVEQRAALAARGQTLQPHLLSMSATPIPRTLAQTVFGDFDISILRMMPEGRKRIVTRLVDAAHRTAAYDFIRKEIASGRQAFVICPLIDPSDTLGVRAATDTHAHLQKDIFPEFAVGLLHGRVKAKEREELMRRFRANDVQILVATTVVEVGIDVPNATIMMIEGAERFGLAQLHQLRGRVGRGREQSYCLLATESVDSTVRRRLTAVVRSDDGFALAEADLAFRGPGELFGARQSGYIDLRFARWNDAALLKETKKAAEERHAQDATIDAQSLSVLS